MLSRALRPVQNLILDDDMADLLKPLHPKVKCTVVAGARSATEPLRHSAAMHQPQGLRLGLRSSA